MLILRDFAGRLGLKRCGPSFRGTCPACSYPDAFSLSVGRNGGILVYCFSCMDFSAIRRAIGGLGDDQIGADAGPNAVPPDGEAKRLRRLKAAIRTWNESISVPGSPAEQYLARRGLAEFAGSTALRCCQKCHHPLGSRLPALVALAVDAYGQPLGVHRTCLSSDGRKADIAPVRASLGNLWGGAIRLEPGDPDLPLGSVKQLSLWHLTKMRDCDSASASNAIQLLSDGP